MSFNCPLWKEVYKWIYYFCRTCLARCFVGVWISVHRAIYNYFGVTFIRPEIIAAFLLNMHGYIPFKSGINNWIAKDNFHKYVIGTILKDDKVLRTVTLSSRSQKGFENLMLLLAYTEVVSFTPDPTFKATEMMVINF